MKPIALITLFISILFSVSAWAGSNTMETPATAPIGEWVYEGKWPTGEVVEARMTVTVDGRFFGVRFINGQLEWTYSGVWRIAGNEFTYVYKESENLLPDNYEDTDIILSVNDFRAKFQGKSTGDIITYIRVR